jgi:hypothetical protein
MILGVVSGAAAQGTPPAQNPSGSGSASGDVKTAEKSDDGAALPRAASGERTTIFGLSPTAAVIIAAALLVVVILAIVAMTRSGTDTTYIDRGGRPPVI